eukprot:scaffold1385_cov403-Prasinococcus_capsulatus_cf.AAC.8
MILSPSLTVDDRGTELAALRHTPNRQTLHHAADRNVDPDLRREAWLSLSLAVFPPRRSEATRTRFHHADINQLYNIVIHQSVIVLRNSTWIKLIQGIT